MKLKLLFLIVPGVFLQAALGASGRQSSEESSCKSASLACLAALFCSECKPEDNGKTTCSFPSCAGAINCLKYSYSACDYSCCCLRSSCPWGCVVGLCCIKPSQRLGNDSCCHVRLCRYLPICCAYECGPNVRTENSSSRERESCSDTYNSCCEVGCGEGAFVPADENCCGFGLTCAGCSSWKSDKADITAPPRPILGFRI